MLTSLMGEYDAVSFMLWSLVTAILMGTAAFSYRAYLRRSGRGGVGGGGERSSEIPPS